MKIKRLLSTILCLAMVIGLVPAMSLTASATVCSSHYVSIKGGTVNIGDEISLRESAYLQDLENGSDYGVQNTYSYSVSDSSVAKITGNKLKFLKSGNVTLNIKHTQTFDKTKKTSTHNDTVDFKVAVAQVIQTTTIKLDSNKFVGGGTFPEFVVTSDSNCKVTEATFYAEMCDYYTGDKLPAYRSGTVMKNVTITLKPETGYVFAFGGSNDNKFHENTVYTVEYKGKTYIPYVKHNTEENEMVVYLDATFEEGAIYQTTIKDLEAPYHYGPLDKTATVEGALEVVSIKYTMFNKELTSFAKGDNIAVVVRVKTKDSTNKIDPNGKAYWMEQKIYSSETTAISDYEVEYGFSYRVDARDEQTIKWADFSIPSVYTGESLPENAFSATDGIKVKSVTWSPNDEKADANKEYTVKIEFGKKDEFVYASDFAEQGVVSINGERAKFVDESTSSGKFKNIKYYAEATFKPITVVFADPSDNTTTTTTTTTGKTEQWVTGTIVGTATTEGTDKTEDSNKEETKKEETEKEETKKEETEKEESEKEDTKKEESEKDEKEDSKKESGSDSSSGGSSGDSWTEAYTFTFTDVSSSQWYYTSVKDAHKMGLINGKTESTFCPDDNMTYAEAVKLAACMNILYNGGDPNKDIAPGKDVWYSTYMEYALDNAIIDDDLTSKANEKITRKEYVYIFSKALPEKAFAKKNNIPTGSIPDVEDEKFAQDKAIYLFYRAGILAGNDSKGTFSPNSNITRAEVAAILIRMMDSSARVAAPKDLGK